jgi:hypothetical protein
LVTFFDKKKSNIGKKGEELKFRNDQGMNISMGLGQQNRLSEALVQKLWPIFPLLEERAGVRCIPILHCPFIIFIPQGEGRGEVPNPFSHSSLLIYHSKF